MHEISHNEETPDNDRDKIPVQPEIEMLNLNVVKLLLIPVKIEGRDALAMIDSGATSSFISTTLCNNLSGYINKDDRKTVIGSNINLVLVEMLWL